MAGHYAPKTFIRQVRGALMNRCLSRHGINLDLNLESIKPAIVERLYERLMSLPPDKLRLIESDFTAIAELASERGTEALLREARRQQIDLAGMFLYCRNSYERACWTFLEHPRVFSMAACFQEMDRFTDGRWDRRYVGEGLRPATDPAAMQQLAGLMRRSFAKEGRGRHCHIDHYIRQQPLRYCFFAFPEDHPSTDLAYTEGGDLYRRARKSAFEVIFIYRPDDGVLELLAPSGAQRVEDLACCFCMAMLNLPALPPKILPRVFDLSLLKSPELTFHTDPRDGIERVELREVQLNLGCVGGWKRRISLAADDGACRRESMHDMILRTINGGGVDLHQVVVLSARFCIIFTAVGNRRPKQLTFTITGTDHCTLRDNHYDQIARRCLRRWGLMLDTIPALRSASRRSA